MHSSCHTTCCCWSHAITIKTNKTHSHHHRRIFLGVQAGDGSYTERVSSLFESHCSVPSSARLMMIDRIVIMTTMMDMDTTNKPVPDHIISILAAWKHSINHSHHRPGWLVVTIRDSVIEGFHHDRHQLTIVVLHPYIQLELWILSLWLNACASTENILAECTYSTDDNGRSVSECSVMSSLDFSLMLMWDHVGNDDDHHGSPGQSTHVHIVLLLIVTRRRRYRLVGWRVLVKQQNPFNLHGQRSAWKQWSESRFLNSLANRMAAVHCPLPLRSHRSLKYCSRDRHIGWLYHENPDDDGYHC